MLQWCSGCSNGGTLVNCSFCQCRAACNGCIQFPPPATLQSSKFMCLVCHLVLRKEDLVICGGNPGVFFADPDPTHTKPIPQAWGRGFQGSGVSDPDPQTLGFHPRPRT